MSISGSGKLGSRLDRRSRSSGGGDGGMEVMEVVRKVDWEVGEVGEEAARAVMWVCNASCWECRRRYFCRLKARSGDL